MDVGTFNYFRRTEPLPAQGESSVSLDYFRRTEPFIAILYATVVVAAPMIAGPEMRVSGMSW
jgi:hypothetical protein